MTIICFKEEGIKGPRTIRDRKAEQGDNLGGMQVIVGKGAYKWGKWRCQQRRGTEERKV